MTALQLRFEQSLSLGLRRWRVRCARSLHAAPGGERSAKSPGGESPKGSPPRGGFARFAPGGDCSTSQSAPSAPLGGPSLPKSESRTPRSWGIASRELRKYCMGEYGKKLETRLV